MVGCKDGVDDLVGGIDGEDDGLFEYMVGLDDNVKDGLDVGVDVGLDVGVDVGEGESPFSSSGVHLLHENGQYWTTNGFSHFPSLSFSHQVFNRCCRCSAVIFFALIHSHGFFSVVLISNLK